MTRLNRILSLVALAAAVTLAGPAAAKPLVIVLADARGTVAPDLLAPYAILADGGAVEVKVASATPAPVRLTPGKAWVTPQTTLAQVARGRRPDVIIVPALSVVDDPARAAWLRTELQRGARVMSICNGAKVLAAAGLLDGRQATVHWFSLDRLARAYPKTTWRRDLRWVDDGPITTTVGISAAEPATLELLRELAGETAMRETARRLRLALPDPRHASGDYRLTPRGMGVTTGNLLAFWRREDVAVPLSPGLDELAFGTAMDAWSRTFRSTAWAVGAPSVVSRHGLVISRNAELPARFARTVAPAHGDPVADAFDQIRLAYGRPTAKWVALQFEHPYGAVSTW